MSTMVDNSRWDQRYQNQQGPVSMTHIISHSSLPIWALGFIAPNTFKLFGIPYI